MSSRFISLILLSFIKVLTAKLYDISESMPNLSRGEVSPLSYSLWFDYYLLLLLLAELQPSSWSSLFLFLGLRLSLKKLRLDLDRLLTLRMLASGLKSSGLPLLKLILSSSYITAPCRLFLLESLASLLESRLFFLATLCLLYLSSILDLNLFMFLAFLLSFISFPALSGLRLLSF